MRVYEHVRDLAQHMNVGFTVSRCLREAESRPPTDYERDQGWVLIALQNAFYQLLHAPTLEEGVVDSVWRGGDTDTNAAIASALLGAIWGIKAVPGQWLESVLNCRPQRGRNAVHRPRPQQYWPVDILTFAAQLLGTSAA
jgi:ADP-ribosylglycohydrolase